MTPPRPADAASTTPLDSRATQLIIRGATIPLQENDPREIGGIRLHARFPGGSQSTRKYLGRDNTGYHFIKILNDEALLVDFSNETRLAKKIANFPTLPQFTGYGTAKLCGMERPYYSQRLVNGECLTNQIGSGLFDDRLNQLANDLAAAIRDLNTLNIAHGDIKPDNIIDNGRYTLVDIGSARSLIPAEQPEGMQNTGTPDYLSPERIRGAGPSGESDVFSWGVVILHSATGKLPENLASTESLVNSSLGLAIERLPERWRALVRSSLQPDPHERIKPIDLAWQAASLSTPQTVVLTTDHPDKPSAGQALPLPKGTAEIARITAALGNLEVHIYRIALIAIMLISSWITYAIIVGGRNVR